MKQAQQQQKAIALALRHHNLQPRVTTELVSGAEPYWRVGTLGQRYVPVGDFRAPGRPSADLDWLLSTQYRYRNDPVADTSELFWSSTSVNVLLDQEPVCVVRYDHDSDRDDDAFHLNILQPHGLEDRIHYAVPIPSGEALDSGSWSINWVLRQLLAPNFTADIADRFDPTS